MANVELKVSGMTCGHCTMHVTEELEALSNVTGVEVALTPDGLSRVQVTYDGELSDDALREAVDEAGGYVVEDITRV